MVEGLLPRGSSECNFPVSDHGDASRPTLTQRVLRAKNSRVKTPARAWIGIKYRRGDDLRAADVIVTTAALTLPGKSFCRQSAEMRTFDSASHCDCCKRTCPTVRSTSSSRS